MNFDRESYQLNSPVLFKWLIGFPQFSTKNTTKSPEYWGLSLGYSRKQTSDYSLLTRNNLIDKIGFFSSSANLRALGTSLVIVLKTLVWRAMLVVFLFCFNITPTFTCNDRDMFRCLLAVQGDSKSYINIMKSQRVYDHSNEIYWAELSCNTVYYARSSLWIKP